MHFDAFAKRNLSLEAYLGPLGAPPKQGRPASPQPVPAQSAVPGVGQPSASAVPSKTSREPGVALN